MWLHQESKGFSFDDRWTILLGFKIIIFILLVFLTFGSWKMSKYLESPASNGGFNERAEIFRHRLQQFRIIGISLGILTLLIAVAMNVYE